MQDSDYYTKYDSKSFDSMTAICERYNLAVDQYHRQLTDSQDTAKVNNHSSSSTFTKISHHRSSSTSSTSSSSSPYSTRRDSSSSLENQHMLIDPSSLSALNGQEPTRVNRPLLKHILTKCYNKSVTDPNELNHYEAFTPEVYGETSFELICQILDKLTPISEDNKFVDLGSGVGQVVLQVAALTNCSFSLGIEKANTPAKYAKEMENSFRYWMAFYGKVYSPFKLIHGDFLDVQHRPGILASTIVFVNNFAFGPEVDQNLKDVFAELNDGARIFSSKSFCALNFRITERNLSDIGTIMHVSKMDPLKGSVSWTGKPVSYYLHVIDRAKLERYFQKNAAIRKGDKDDEGSGRRSRRRRDLAMPVKEENGVDSSDSRDVSRASSVERDENSNPGIRRVPSIRAANTNRKLTAAIKRLHEDESMDMIPPAPAGTPISGVSTQPTSDTEGDDSQSRPQRAAVANATAISEALAGKKKKGRPRKVPVDLAELAVKNERIASSISGLDLLHDTTLRCIEESNDNEDAPLGCVNERLSQFPPKGLIEHVELPQSLRHMPDGGKIPHQLHLFLETIKNQYLTFMDTMQDETFKVRVLSEMEAEKKRQVELNKREKQLKAQIENLINDSLGLLKCRLQELGIKAKTPPEFIEKAKGIVCNHHELQKNKGGLDAEIKQLEADKEKLIQAKEKELSEKLGLDCPDLTPHQIKEMVRKEVDHALRPSRPGEEGPRGPNRVAPLLNKLSDVTFTKCGSEQVSTQIRKRPREQTHKQRDWPEKRCKAGGHASGVSSGPPSPSGVVAKIEEKNPDMLARKIIDEGRTLERRTSAATLTISPTKSRSYRDSFPPHHPVGGPLPVGAGPGVEIRKLETISPPYHRAPQGAPMQRPNSIVDLPKIDLAASLANSTSHHHLPTSSSSGLGLHLPPRPDSRSRSSERTGEGDVSFAKSKMSTTPRAEQFEDRLKTIIHSVLSGDQHGQTPTQGPPLPPGQPQGGGMGGPPLAHSHDPKGGLPQQNPMFSPVKRELPMHLPPPPNTHHGMPPSSSSSSGHHPAARALQYPSYPPQQHHPSHRGPPHPGMVMQRHPAQTELKPHHAPLPGMGGPPPPPPTSSSSSRTMNDLIASEIERNLNPASSPSGSGSAAGSRRGSYASSDTYPPPASRHPPPVASEGANNLSRTMSQVIEDSIRGHLSGSRRGGGELEGLALPRTKSPEPSPPRSALPMGAGGDRPSVPPGTVRNGGNNYPAMEGLAARFGTYMAAETKRSIGEHPRDRYLASLAAREQEPPHPSSSSRVVLPGADRKRGSPSLTSPGPVLPPKKQHLDENPDYRLPHKDENKQQWQDAISTGFDRLVAYATEVDRRRKSTDSNSPSHASSPKYNAPSGGSAGADSGPSREPPFDNRVSTLSMKFKGSYRRCNSSPPPNRERLPRVPTPGSSSSRAATPSGTVGRVPTPGQSGPRGRSPLPGENLPDHHPKKRYFAETRDSTSASSSASSTYGGVNGPTPSQKPRPILNCQFKSEPPYPGYGSGASQSGRPPQEPPHPVTPNAPAPSPR
eukprot:maker-scaffold61_size441589-snap-gene-3.32 protein:Tk06310 transcript:maker-scaffold61_size441589-snap-gene-3.32-mRNA-1 annotation:"histone h3"